MALYSNPFGFAVYREKYLFSIGSGIKEKCYHTLILLGHTGLDQFRIPLEYDISDFLICWSNSIGKAGERKKINFPRWSSEVPAN